MVNAPADDPKTLFKAFEDQMRNPNVSSAQAIEWFKKNAKFLQSINANVLMARNPERLRSSTALSQSLYTGRMAMFFYMPKFRETLPYYDMFPLAIVIKNYKDGFLGLNLHYLPIQYRAKLLDSLHRIYKSKEYDEKQKLAMNWNILKSISGTKYFKPCVKRYLYVGNDHRGGGVTSRFNIVDPTEWDKMILLPVERFVKKSASQVQSESLSKIGIRNH